MNRIENQKHVVQLMIRLYCRGKHGNKGEALCPECQALKDYAIRRLSVCRFGNHKPNCDKCVVHCYEPEQREKIRQVMRYSGPRMLWHHPIIAIKHLVSY